MSKSPEHIVLAVALVLLALGAAGLAYTFPALPDIVGFASVEPKGHGAKKINAEDLESRIVPWNAPTNWKTPDSGHRLFNPEDYLFYPSLYPGGDYIRKLDEKARSPGGVLLSWYRKYGIDITSPGVDRDDPDGDGFSNIVEFKNEKVGQKLNANDVNDDSNSTNPSDPSSHPSYLARLRLDKYESRPFHIKFNGYEQLNGVYEFQIFLKDIGSSGQPPYKKTGDQLGYEGYIVGDFHQSVVTKVNPSTGIEEQVDESTLTLLKPDIGLTITLVYRKETDSPESTANFVMLMPNDVDKVIKVPRGKVLDLHSFLPAATGQYLVLDVDDNGTKIRDTQTKQEYQIPKLDPAEWNEVPLSPQGNATKSP